MIEKTRDPVGHGIKQEQNWSPDTEGRKPEHFKERGRDFGLTLLPQ